MMFFSRLIFALLPLAALAQTPPPPKPPEVPAELPPKIELLQPGVKLTLLAEHPDLVTPTGIDVDDKGRIWLAACHTHFRPEGYAGPEHDEILVFDADGKNRRVFYNKTDATMHVECGPDGWLYLAERDRILRVKDSDGDGVGDVEENLATLDTVANYPHNGLSGMAWHPEGGLVFSLGENFGKDWTLTARDGSKVSGRGEGGVFRCTADGKEMRRVARGFWNPFGLMVRTDGEIFAAENDPGSRPPCRLLNIVEGADYGFQWVYGSAPVHPFVAWNGELRGTLGMIHPCGEGPCAIIELGGGVLIPSWSDHSIDYFPLTRKGAGHTSVRVPLLKGSDFFRPVCMTRGADGAYYLTDWVFSSYPIHGRGRLWKLEITNDAPWIKQQADAPTAEARLAKGLREGTTKLPQPKLLSLASQQSADPYLSDAALTALARESKTWTPDTLKKLPPKDRVWALVALRRVDLNEGRWVRAFIGDADPEMRFECLRWTADAVLTSFMPQVEAMLGDPKLDFRLFEAALATWNTLRGEPGAGVTNPEVLVERITNSQTPARIKGYALRLVPPNHAKITVPLLRELLAMDDEVLTLEVVRALAVRKASADIAADETRSALLRAEAIVGVEDAALLQKLAGEKNAVIRDEARRALRFTEHDKSFAVSATRPAFDDTEGWLKMLDALPGTADAETGRRLFFHPKVALCATCHRHSGRGNVVGPDLSLVAQQGDRAAILRSILEPHREVAPQFYPSQVKLKDGTEFIGILLRSSSFETFRDLTGKERTFPQTDIVSRTELKTSLMPPGLVMSLTDVELRDLLAFLMNEFITPAQPEEFAHAGVTAAWEAYADMLTFGKGQTLALLDDGCTLSKPEWQAKVDGVPKVRVTYDAVDGDADPKHEGKGYHGTTIGIPSSINHAGKRGVAFNNQIAIVRSLECCHCKVGDSASLARALQWVIDHHAEHHITTVNVAPVDDQEHAAPVPTEIDEKLARLRELGIWVSAPAGNHNFTKGISWPASQPNCFAIGAVAPGKEVAILDRSAKIDLLVPARATSSSNAIVCGAAMVLREAIEKSDYDWKKDGADMATAMMKIMQQSGVPVEDKASGQNFRRLDLMAALKHVNLKPTNP